MERHRFLIAVADASVPIVVLQVFYYELLPDVDDPVELLCDQVQQFYRELIGPDSKHLAFMVELEGCYRTPIIGHFVERFHRLVFF